MIFKHTMIVMLLLFFATTSAMAQPKPANEQRYALVVGNSDYKTAPLRNPVNDADDVAAALEGLGFRVTKIKNGSARQMRESVEAFSKQLRQGGVGLFFYAGHGVQSRGRNFLMPVNANINTEADLEYESLDANLVLAKMDEAGNRVNMIILDACRDNPYARSFRNASRGLAPMEAARGSLIAFATTAGSVASDGTGRNGLYTQHLLASLKHADSDVHKVFSRVTADVARSSGNKQIPWKSDSLTGDFQFRQGGGVNVALAQPSVPVMEADPRANDRAVWESVKDSSNTAELQAYLDQFPNGIFAGVARARMKAITPPPPVQVAVAPPSTAPGITLPATTLAAGSQTPGTVFRDCDVCPQMAVIPAGVYFMGDNNNGFAELRHPVTIARPFAAGKFEVTFDEWDACVRERGCTHNPGDVGWGRGNRPVINVSWDDAKQYTQWLSLKTGHQYRLLSEAEWEYVARAGTTTPFNTGASINPTQANYAANESFAGSVTGVARNQTIAVGSYPANAFGLHDMHGNVWEWTEDCWNANYNGAPSDGSTRASGDCGQRVVRGGSWSNVPQGLRSAGRSNLTSGIRNYAFGLRAARTF